MNRSPKQSLEESEAISVLQLPLSGLLDSICQLAKNHGFGIDEKLYTFALGLDLGRRMADRPSVTSPASGAQPRQ